MFLVFTSFSLRNYATLEFSDILDMSMSSPSCMPGLVKNYVADESISRIPRHRLIFLQQIYQQDLLDGRLADINAPTLILWGEKDNFLHPSMAGEFHRASRTPLY